MISSGLAPRIRSLLLRYCQLAEAWQRCVIACMNRDTSLILAWLDLRATHGDVVLPSAVCLWKRVMWRGEEHVLAYRRPQYV